VAPSRNTVESLIRVNIHLALIQINARVRTPAHARDTAAIEKQLLSHSLIMGNYTCAERGGGDPQQHPESRQLDNRLVICLANRVIFIRQQRRWIKRDEHVF